MATDLLQASSVPTGLVIVSLITLSYYSLLARSRRDKKPYANLPTSPDTHWLMGHIPVLLQGDLDEAHNHLMEHVDKHGRLGMYMLGSTRAIMLTNASDARIVLNAESNREFVPHFKQHIAQVLGEKNLLFLNGREWKVHRSAVVKSMSPSALATAQEAMIQVAKVAVASLKDRIADSKEESLDLDVFPFMKMITMDVFGKAALSHDFGSCRSLTPSSVAQLFDFTLEDIIRRIEAIPFDPREFYSLPTSRNRSFSVNRRELRAFVTKAIEDRKASNVRHNDMLQNLLDAQNREDYNSESTSALADVLLLVLFAGYDTTSITLSYAMYLLSQFPEVEAKCLEEIASVPDWEERFYLKAVITETLRLFPAAAITARDLEKDVTLSDGLVLPRGSKMFIGIWHIHRSEANFERASEFVPERWVTQVADGSWKERDPTTDTDSVPIRAADPKNFLAFSGGGRSCAGTRFARMEAAIVLGTLLEEFRFEAKDGYVLKTKRRPLVQGPEDGLPMKISIRNI